MEYVRLSWEWSYCRGSLLDWRWDEDVSNWSPKVDDFGLKKRLMKLTPMICGYLVPFQTQEPILWSKQVANWPDPIRPSQARWRTSLEDGPSLYPHAEACPKVAPPNWWRDRPVVSVLGLSHLMMGEATGRRIYDHQGLFTTNPRWNGTSRCCLCQLVSDDEVTTLVRQVLMRIHIQAGTILNCFWKGQNSDSVTNSGEFSTNSQTFESCPRYLLWVSQSYSIYVCTLHILAEVVAYHRPLVYTSLQLLHNSPNFSVILPMFSGEIADS